MIKKIALFWGEDWEGLYINGRRVFENHSIRASEIVDELGKRGMEVAVVEVDDDWLMDVGSLPANATDVVVADR